MSLERRCNGWFSAGDTDRGYYYFLENRVSIQGIDPDSVYATVRGSRHAPYDVWIDWESAESGHLTISCDCPRFADSIPCKHLWATILTCDREGLSDAVPGHAPLSVDLEIPEDEWNEPDDDRQDDDPFAHEVRSPRDPDGSPYLPVPGGRLTFRPQSPPAGSTGGWRRQLSTLRDDLGRAAPCGSLGSGSRRQAWYHLDVHSSARGGQLVVELRQREIRKNGTWGKIKRLSLSRQETATFSDPEDRELLDLLLATPPADNVPRYAYGYRYTDPRYEASSVPEPLYDVVLPRLCATGRFCRQDEPDAPSLTWDDGRAWKLALHLDHRGDSGSVAVTGSLARDGQTRGLDEPVLLLAAGLVIFPDTIARLEAKELFPWITMLRRDREIVVPEDKVDDLLAELWKLPALPALEAPDDLRWHEERATPRPCLAVRTPEPDRHGVSKLLADVSFDYGGRSVDASDPGTGLVDADKRRVLVRDSAAEREALETLVALGLEPVDRFSQWATVGRFSRRGTHGTFHDFELPVKTWPAVAERLAGDGWQLEYEQARLRRPGAFNLQLTTDIDWFELEGDVEFDDLRLALPELLEAVRRGQQFVTLDDGTQGMLPAEWLERYSSLAHLAPESEDGSVRFLPSQAMLLDALLAAAPKVDVDRRFRRIRRRLRSFERVEPAAEPRGFRGRLRAYQRDGLGWLRFLKEFGFGGCLADDMGLGKTVQVLAHFQWRRLGRGAADRPSLVVAPRSVLDNWAEEAARFAPRLEVLVFHGPRRRPLFEAFDRHHLILTTYAILLRDIAKLKDFAFDYVVLDEAQAIKNAASQTAKASRLLQGRHRLALTGTPVENHLGELWSIFEFLSPGMLGRLPRLKPWGGKKTLDHEALSTVAGALRPFILRRTKEQVLKDLPAKTEQTLFCDLGTKQRRLYNELRDHYRALLTQRIRKVGIKRSKIQVLEALLRLRQAACHPGLIDEERAQDPSSFGGTSAKLDVLLPHLEEVLDEGHKVLVFSQFVKLLKILRGVLDRRKIAYAYLDGRTRKRKERIERFQTDPSCQLFLISLKAGGLGLNLTAADYVFILDPWWNPAVEAQAIDRAHRIGQTRPVFAYRLISRNTVEEKILQLQAGKRELADAILTADRSLIRDLTAEDLRLLLD